MHEYEMCDNCGVSTRLYQYFDAQSNCEVSLCESDYRKRMQPDRANFVQPPGMRRMNSRLSKVALDASLEPTDMERFLVEQEQQVKLSGVQDRFAQWEAKFGDDDA